MSAIYSVNNHRPLISIALDISSSLDVLMYEMHQ